jgi:methyl coenzyme M reductase subunit D
MAARRLSLLATMASGRPSAVNEGRVGGAQINHQKPQLIWTNGHRAEMTIATGESAMNEPVYCELQNHV